MICISRRNIQFDVSVFYCLGGGGGGRLCVWAGGGGGGVVIFFTLVLQRTVTVHFSVYFRGLQISLVCVFQGVTGQLGVCI